jgi:hypothetical protein
MTWQQFFAIIGVIAAVLVMAVVLFKALGWWRR